MKGTCREVSDTVQSNKHIEVEFEQIPAKVIVNYWYRRLPFNMKISKEFSRIIMNGKDISIDNTKLVKIDIANTEIENADIRVKYKICVTNTA